MPVTRKRLMTLAIEVLLALGLVAGVLLYADHGPLPWMPSAGWWMLAGMTALLFWRTIVVFRSNWPQRTFWASVAGLFVVHLLVWVILIKRIPELRPIWFIPAFAVELALFILCLNEMGFRPTGDDRQVTERTDQSVSSKEGPGSQAL